MKIKTKMQLLVLLVVVNFIVFFAIAMVCKYYFDLNITAILMGTSAVLALVQYQVRKNQLQ